MAYSHNGNFRGHTLVELNKSESDGNEKKAWYPLTPAGEVHVSVKWNTVEVKVISLPFPSSLCYFSNLM